MASTKVLKICEASVSGCRDLDFELKEWKVAESLYFLENLIRSFIFSEL